MRERLTKRIQELSDEATKLVKERERLGSMIGEIEVRLHQITGAIIDLDKLLQDVTADSERSHKDPEGSKTPNP